MTSRLERRELVKDLKNWVRYQEGSGVKGFSKKSKVIGSAVKKRVGNKGETLESIKKDLGDCMRCSLHRERTKIVFGSGNPNAELVFIGEAPGRDEDLQGEPFVGRAGQLLTKIIEAMGMKRSDVYITNILKSRPPNNRVPEPDEVATCVPFLHRQLDVIKPKVIVTLGATAILSLLKLHGEAKIGDLRGKWQEFNGFPVLPTYHPAFLLRNPNMKRVVWEDMKIVMKKLKDKKG